MTTKLADLTARPVPPQDDEYTAAALDWRGQRVSAFNALVRGLTCEQQAEVSRLLKLAQAEAELKGAYVGTQVARRQARTENTHMNELLKKAADDNAALRDRAHVAETELISLKAALPAVERVTREKIIAAAPADYRPLPRMTPRSGVFHRHLSHGFHIRRIARRIEEFIAGPECRGYCSPEKLADHLLPETPAPTYQQAVTHLMLSGRIKQSSSGAYRLRNPKGEPK